MSRGQETVDLVLVLVYNNHLDLIKILAELNLKRKVLMGCFIGRDNLLLE